VKPSITTPAGLRGKKIATPQLGNTQDVALRSWLKDNGLKTDLEGGGDVSIMPQENSQTLQTFLTGDIDGAWVPEPWATRLVTEGHGAVLVDERTLWPAGKYATTLLVVRTEFLRAHPDTVKQLLAGQVEANDLLAQKPAQAQTAAVAAIADITGKKLKPSLVAAAWKNLTFTNDPIASSVVTSVAHAESLGLLEGVSLDGMFDLTLLNDVLSAKHEPAVTL